MIEAWFYILVCTGTYWCAPEHNNWQVYTTYDTIAECEAEGAIHAKKSSHMGEKWIAVCVKGVRAK